MRRFLTGSAAILTVLSFIAGCTSSDDTADETTTAAPATTVAPAATVAADATTTTAVVTTAAESGDGVVPSFDGATCTYQGPEVVSPTEILSVSFTNESDGVAGMLVTKARSEDLEEVRALVGMDLEPDELPDIAFGIPAVEIQVDPGESMTQNVLWAAGTWVVVCHTYEPGVAGAAHLWYVGVVESE